MPLSDLWGDDGESSHGGEDGNEAPANDHEAGQRRKQQQTQKARNASLVSRAVVKCKQQFGIVDNEPTGGSQSWAVRLQQGYLTPFFATAAERTKTNPFSKANFQKLAIERSRVLMSYLLQLPPLLKRLFTAETNDGQRSIPHHVLECIILDDTSTKLRGSDGVPVIHTVMNTVQTVHVAFNHGWDSVQLPTPYICLPSQKTEDLFLGYAYCALFSSQGLGKILEVLDRKSSGENRDGQDNLESLISKFKWKIHIFIGDALATNSAVFRFERGLQFKSRASGGWGILSIRIKCVLHQLCLVRRPAVLSVDRFWATLVRLAHLFEQQSFRRQFAFALLQIFREPGGFKRRLVDSNLIIPP